MIYRQSVDKFRADALDCNIVQQVTLYVTNETVGKHFQKQRKTQKQLLPRFSYKASLTSPVGTPLLLMMRLKQQPRDPLQYGSNQFNFCANCPTAPAAAIATLHWIRPVGAVGQKDRFLNSFLIHHPIFSKKLTIRRPNRSKKVLFLLLFQK